MATPSAADGSDDVPRGAGASDVPPDVAPIEGEGIVNLSFLGVGLALAAAAFGVASPDRFGVVVVVVSVGLFAIGCGVFLWAFAGAVARSRYEDIGIGGLFFLADSAPKVVAFRLRVALAAQLVVALVAASIRPFTAVAAIVLVPIFGLGLSGLWGARYGTFPARADADPRPGGAKGRTDPQGP